MIYLAITDGGDGDVNCAAHNTLEKAEADVEEALSYQQSYSAIIEIDFDKQTVKRI